MLTNVKTSENTRNFFSGLKSVRRREGGKRIFYGNVMI